VQLWNERYGDHRETYREMKRIFSLHGGEWLCWFLPISWKFQLLAPYKFLNSLNFTALNWKMVVFGVAGEQIEKIEYSDAIHQLTTRLKWKHRHE